MIFFSDLGSGGRKKKVDWSFSEVLFILTGHFQLFFSFNISSTNSKTILNKTSKPPVNTTLSFNIAH